MRLFRIFIFNKVIITVDVKTIFFNWRDVLNSVYVLCGMNLTLKLSRTLTTIFAATEWIRRSSKTNFHPNTRNV